MLDLLSWSAVRSLIFNESKAMVILALLWPSSVGICLMNLTLTRLSNQDIRATEEAVISCLSMQLRLGKC